MEIGDEFKAESGPMIFTSYETGNELDLEKMFNHLGPETTFAMANKLLEMVSDDFNTAMKESTINGFESKIVEYERGYHTASVCFAQHVNIQQMFNDSRHSLNQNDFDKGWQKFCLENGAVDDKDGFKSIA